ncbi:MAG TPA: TlpA disulfide reductase family protein [Terriglobia bacterium]|nr:TlpA disulfide reductase family protein [Terriglobia bacterium]
MQKSQIALLAVATLVAVAAIYLLNRYWIAPATVEHEPLPASHPSALDFTVTDFSGNQVSLSGLRGKVVLLDFWATWCGPCRMEIPSFVQFADRYRDQGLSALGIVTHDSPRNVPGFYRQFRMNYPVAMGSEQLEGLYGVYGLPTTLLIGRDGRIYNKLVGAVQPAYLEREIQKLLSEKTVAER